MSTPYFSSVDSRRGKKAKQVKGVETERMDESQLMTATHVYASFLAHVINTPVENT